MNSKLTKIISGISIFGALVLSANASYADGDYPMHKKTHKAKVVECEHKPVAEPCYDAAPMSMKKCGLGSGMTFGVGVDFGFAINGNSDFIVAAIPVGTGTPAIPAAATKAITFAQKHDSLYGAYANIGWMMDNGLEANVELGYHQLKFKDKNFSSNSMEDDILSGMLNLTYYADLFDGMFLPYVTVGAGIGRIDSKGTLYDTTDSATANVITFKDLTKTTFGYQAGVGVATSFDSIVLGVGYKFLGFSSFSDSNSDLSVTVVDKDAVGGVINSSAFNFGSKKINTHNVTVFAKFTI